MRQEIGHGGATRGRAPSYRLGERVRTASRARLEATLYDPRAARRPSPAHFQAAGREARVVSVLLDGAAPLHRLEALATLWPAEWLEPVARRGA